MKVLPICTNQHITQDKPLKFNWFILDGSSFECVSIKQNRKKVIFEDIQYKFNTMITKTQKWIVKSMSSLITIFEKLGWVKSPQVSLESIKDLLSNNSHVSMYSITKSYLPQGMTQYPPYRRLGGPQSQSRRCKNFGPNEILW
jgi:hypothetical protein